MTVLVALSCLAVNAAAVSGLPRLSLEALGPFALAYHDKAPSFVFVPILVLMLVLVKALSFVGRVAALFFVGAAIANITSPLIWEPGVPDYIVLREIDVIANVSDVLMLSSAVAIAASISLDLVRRALGRAPS